MCVKPWLTRLLLLNSIGAENIYTWHLKFSIFIIQLMEKNNTFFPPRRRLKADKGHQLSTKFTEGGSPTLGAFCCMCNVTLNTLPMKQSALGKSILLLLAFAANHNFQVVIKCDLKLYIS